MPFSQVDLSTPPLPQVALPPTPEVIDVPADLPTLEPDIVISFPLNEQVMDMVVVPAEHDGQDVVYVAVSQERVNVWAALVYFNPEIALGVTAVFVLVALRKLWVTRRFTHRKGEAYCKKCWAGLTGVESASCPECGRAVKKTRRNAKRSKRSLTHPRWCWALSAILMTLATTTLWFGESWHGLCKHGFDGQNPDHWWALVNPPDRDGPVRINRAAGWFSWYSADLAKHARENDAAWIEKLLWEYEDDAGVRYRLAIRRYATTDGQLLTNEPYPVESNYQDQSDWGSTDLILVRLHGIVLVSDSDACYRYRFDAPDRWVLFGEVDISVYRHTAALIPGGRHIMFGQHIDTATGGVFSSRSDLQVAVYDVDTGERRSLLLTTSGGPRVDGGDPEVRTISASEPPTWEVDFTTNAVLPLDDGNVLLVGGMGLAIWEVHTGVVVGVPKGTLAVEALRDDLWVGLDYDPVIVRDLVAFPFGNVFSRQIEANRQLGRAWMLEGDYETIHRYDVECELTELLPDIYSWPNDIFLYEVAMGLTSGRPSRAIRFGVVGTDFGGLWLSPCGDWLAVDLYTWFSGAPHIPVPVVVDLEMSEAIGMVPGLWTNDFLSSGYINGGRQLLLSGLVEIPGAQEYSRISRDELHLYNLPL